MIQCGGILIFLIGYTLSISCFADAPANLNINSDLAHNRIIDLSDQLINQLAFYLEGALPQSVADIKETKEELDVTKQGLDDISTRLGTLKTLLDNADLKQLGTNISGLTTIKSNLDSLNTQLNNLLVSNTADSLKFQIQGLQSTSLQFSNAINRLQNINFNLRPIYLLTGCAEGYYVATCGGENMDIQSWRSLMRGNSLEVCVQNTPNDYLSMREFFKSGELTYCNVKDNDECCSKKSTATKELRDKILSNCATETITCAKCPLDGTTDKASTKKSEQKCTNTSGTTCASGTDDCTCTTEWTWEGDRMHTIADCYKTVIKGSIGTYSILNTTNENEKQPIYYRSSQD